MATEAERACREADATKLRTALLSAVGHDLRTPLTSIKAATGSLRAPDLTLSTADQEELLATIEESADRLTGLIDNLLDSSRLTAGAVRPQLRPVGYDEVAARALSTVDGHGRVAVEVDDRLPQVLADPGLLERVVDNVVDNAVRHGAPRTNGDDPPVAVRASEHADQVELRIVDHGRGVPKKAIDAVFTPFRNAGDRTATSGTIRAEETPGGGLTIVISLPARQDTVKPDDENKGTANYIT